MNIKALNVHEKLEHIEQNINVKIDKRLLKLVKNFNFIKERNVYDGLVLLVTDAEKY